ncbi:hypothetical protein [Metallosphaera sedula]|uniref:hypothetical protein n=1 Tax=Metallosphaera sedula TaxID=43687 RepID=UPI0020C0B3F8|nr:hypothetical protein [Metallosphaera sedula]BBL48348.1 hypothetical protein MJ1HA_2470 [Metallosphaera sedula]
MAVSSDEVFSALGWPYIPVSLSDSLRRVILEFLKTKDGIRTQNKDDADINLEYKIENRSYTIQLTSYPAILIAGQLSDNALNDIGNLYSDTLDYLQEQLKANYEYFIEISISETREIKDTDKIAGLMAGSGIIPLSGLKVLGLKLYNEKPKEIITLDLLLSSGLVSMNYNIKCNSLKECVDRLSTRIKDLGSIFG